MKTKFASVIIPAFNPRLLSTCLKNLSLQEEHIHETIVVEDWVYRDDCSIANVCDSFGVRHLRLPSPKKNPFDFRVAQCRNVGQRAASGEVLLFLDEDCLPCPWYFHRLRTLHEAHPDLYFSAERIWLVEPECDVARDWGKIVCYWTARRKRVNEILFHKTFFSPLGDNRKLVLPEGCNVSFRAVLAKKIGDWVNCFGYGEEDFYHAFKAFRSGARIGYFEDGSDIYVCHVNHPKSHVDGFMAINRLFLYETDPSFRESIEKSYSESQCYAYDWCYHEIASVRENGINSLEAFRFLPEIPDCLKKYVKVAAT